MYKQVLLVASIALLLASPAIAHHSFAMFDYGKQITVTGEVKEFQWLNPHIHILINVADANGVMAEWDIEGGTPNSQRRNGWSKDILKPGDKISVVIRPLKNGGKGGNLIRASRGDGTPVGTPATGG
jgi:hypothetical protein